jgi:DNA repair protein RecN (Recombination protein N)
VRELQQYLDTLDVDTGRQDYVEGRLAAIEELARKHRVTPRELHERARALGEELEALEHADTDLAGLKKDQAAALAQLPHARAAALRAALDRRPAARQGHHAAHARRSA